MWRKTGRTHRCAPTLSGFVRCAGFWFELDTSLRWYDGVNKRVGCADRRINFLVIQIDAPVGTSYHLKINQSAVE
jgi:hypothetical protein